MLHAIILAAGRGQRLADFNPDLRPKCLLEIGGQSLLARQLDWLERVGVDRAVIVVGYQGDRVRQAVKVMGPGLPVDFLDNPRFEQGSVISLLTAAETLQSGDTSLVLDADVLCHPAILERLVNAGTRGATYGTLLVDREFEAGEEPVKVALHEGSIVEFRKRLPQTLEYDTVGESVGFFRFGPEGASRLARRCQGFADAGLADAPHEDAIRAEILDHPECFACEDITGLPWTEIDFPADVRRAGEEILPAIRRDFPDF